ncbi:MAG: SpaA isopeptide-forming pilin-related protein [Bacteroidota bacterium]
MKSVFFALALVSFSLVSFTSEEQVVPTNLRIFIRNELGNTVAGATVQLYATEEDYKNSENPVTEKLKTDSKGRVTFKKLEQKVYFVEASKGDLNNKGGGIETGLLKKGINKATIVIN